MHHITFKSAVKIPVAQGLFFARYWKGRSCRRWVSASRVRHVQTSIWLSAGVAQSGCAGVTRSRQCRAGALLPSFLSFCGKCKHVIHDPCHGPSPRLLRAQIAAHGNSLRALVKHLDNISEDVITGLNIPTGKDSRRRRHCSTVFSHSWYLVPIRRGKIFEFLNGWLDDMLLTPLREAVLP